MTERARINRKFPFGPNEDVSWLITSPFGNTGKLNPDYPALSTLNPVPFMMAAVPAKYFSTKTVEVLLESPKGQSHESP